MNKNAADENQVSKDTANERRLEKVNENDIRILCNMPEFRRFIYWYINRCDRTSVDPSGSYTYFNEGERNICLKIKASINDVDPRFLFKIFEEGIRIRKGEI